MLIPMFKRFLKTFVIEMFWPDHSRTIFESVRQLRLFIILFRHFVNVTIRLYATLTYFAQSRVKRELNDVVQRGD